jgi:hypothetical protein
MHQPRWLVENLTDRLESQLDQIFRDATCSGWWPDLNIGSSSFSNAYRTTLARLRRHIAIHHSPACKAASGAVSLVRVPELSLPGIGPTLAKRIVDFREKKGRIKRVEELLEIPGMSERSGRCSAIILRSSRPQLPFLSDAQAPKSLDLGLVIHRCCLKAVNPLWQFKQGRAVSGKAQREFPRRTRP